jgi:hypothetical protein
MEFARRSLNKMVLAAEPGIAALPKLHGAKPNSTFGGDRVGLIAPYSFQGMAGSAAFLRCRTRLLVSAVSNQTR